MDSVLHGIAALPGEGRYAITFRRPDGSEQTAVVHVNAPDIEIAEASLPSGWSKTGAMFKATADAIHAFDSARRRAPTAPTLRDVDGGWDVSLGNVVLGSGGVATCTAHGEMAEDGGAYVCTECEARAILA
jgi:hypothetical protein